MHPPPILSPHSLFSSTFPLLFRQVGISRISRMHTGVALMSESVCFGSRIASISLTVARCSTYPSRRPSPQPRRWFVPPAPPPPSLLLHLLLFPLSSISLLLFHSSLRCMPPSLPFSLPSHSPCPPSLPFRLPLLFHPLGASSVGGGSSGWQQRLPLTALPLCSTPSHR